MITTPIAYYTNRQQVSVGISHSVKYSYTVAAGPKNVLNR